MHKPMLQRCAQLFSQLGLRHSLAGQGLPERMRSATVALLGVTAAISMAFVAVIAQQGWTVLSLGPIPAPFVGKQAVGNGTALSTAKGGEAAPSSGQPGLVAAAELTAGSQGAQPGRAPAQPLAGTLSGSHAVGSPQQGGGPQGAPPAEGGEGAPGDGETPPSSQPGSAGTPPSSGGGKGTAGVEGKQEKEDEDIESEVSPPAAESTPQEVEDEEESSGSWWEEHSPGHGHGHHHW